MPDGPVPLPLWVRVHDGPTHPLAPAEFGLPQAELPRVDQLVPGWQPDLLAPAPVLAGTEAERRTAAAASAIAHLAGPWSQEGDGDAVRGDVASLHRSGHPVIDPATVITIDPAVAADPRSPLLGLGSDPHLWWVPVRRPADDAVRWAPVAAVHTGPLDRISGAVDGAVQPVGAINLVGLAGGRSREEAIRQALGHVIAHDTVARWWADRDAAPPVHWRRWDAHTALGWLPGPYGIPVILAVVTDPDADTTCVGAHAAADPEQAARHAVALAWHQATLLADLARPDGTLRRTGLQWGGIRPLPWRADRRMLDEAPPIDVPGAGTPPRPALGDPLLALQCGLDPRLRSLLRDRLARRTDGAPPPTDPYDRLAGQVWVREVTPPRYEGQGWTAVRVLWPGALRIDPPALPCRRPALGGNPYPWPGW